MTSNPEVDEPQIDRPFTYRVIIASVIVGAIIASAVGLILFSFARPITVDANGNVNWAVGAVMFPISALFVIAILYWAIFSLPVRIARRRGVLLDPEVWPWTGAVIVGVLAVIGFVGAILLGII